MECVCILIKAIAQGGSYLWVRENEYDFGITILMYDVFSS